MRVSPARRCVALPIVVAVVMAIAICKRVSGQQAALNILDDNAAITFGVASDVNLYRGPGPSLRSDNSFQVVGQFSASNLFSVPTTINVCAACTYRTLNAVWAYLSTIAFTAPVTVQFAAGTYSEPANILFDFHPTPHLITIVGSNTNPSSVILLQPVAGNFLTFYGPGTSGMTFSGFTLLSASPLTGAAIVLSSGTMLTVPAVGSTRSLIVQNFGIGVIVQYNSVLIANNALECTNVNQGVIVQFQSVIYATALALTGASVSSGPAVNCYYGSFANVASSIINTFSTGFSCTPWSAVILTGTSYINCGISMSSDCVGQTN